MVSIRGSAVGSIVRRVQDRTDINQLKAGHSAIDDSAQPEAQSIGDAAPKPIERHRCAHHARHGA